MRTKKLQEADVRKLAYGLCLGLEHFHSLNVAHRDIKPGNIMVNTEGYPVIIDFGVSGSANLKHGSTKYYAPEQQVLEFLQPGMDFKKLDTWALGQTLAECFDDNAGYELKEYKFKEKIYGKSGLPLAINNCSFQG